ncbi:protein SHORTAGE IN CHIASMATA 1-like isoform X2 [Salvia splendens]|uniref:protein SHORTAGE IN CHIASMATA 1-like isoform X2 n=1 Tax=Salvia splendens TaxID=180675 RepID=UPI001C27AFED|nr:protein SHORTAGE IN CHIASMATA 1-like isoform X2 [Salvia splendens]
MRTRFLAAAVTAVTDLVETPDFYHLPLPHLTPPKCSSFSANSAHSFDEIPFFGVSREIDKLPIDDALLIFLADVVPHFVCDADIQKPQIDSNTERYEDNDGPIPGNKGGEEPIVRFEIPEMDMALLPSESSAHSQIEHMDIFSEVPDAEYTEDLLNSEFVLHDLAEIQRLLYVVDDISIENLTEQKADMLEDADSVQGKHHSYNIKFPEFEVDMESLGVIGRTLMMEEVLSFENIEKRQVMQEDNNKELLVSMESDLINYMFHHSEKLNCLEGTNLSSEVDCIRIIELSHNQQYPMLCGKADGFSIWSEEPTPFDEFMFIDLDLYSFCEVLSDSAKEIEYETCEHMFGEAMNFKSFSQLVVCHELTLLDGTFKSLPVPIISDHENSSSLCTLIENLLAQSDWQCSSASDDLYLDWDFLGESDCESAKYSSCWKLLGEIDTYSIDIDMCSNDSGIVILNFILSEGHSRKPNPEKDTEVLDLSCSDVSIPHSSGKVELSSLKNRGDGKRKKDDILLKIGVEKIQLFGESMTSDLEFFLNPRNYVLGKENIPADKPVTKTLSQGCMFSGDSATASSTTFVQQSLNVEEHEERDLGLASAPEGCKLKLEELLNAVPVKKTYGNEPMEAVNDAEVSNMIPVRSMSVGSESKQSLSCMPFGPNAVIIVNTRNFNEEMVISRRTTYQRILEIEQEGAQVVERDIGLPVDVIVSSAVCLTWYDCKNIGKKASAPDEGFSSLPLCIESVAASILTSLSFAFSCCILIFEGESNFLGSIMESSDELYAAAASLGVDIQLFCSYSHEMTEEIILSCIKAAAKLRMSLYPKMPDSESLAESFLTAFPSINPLSAHAILSSDIRLGNLFELSNGSKMGALQKYHIPDESIALLSVASKYGEREDSKSGMTDCSSSLSLPDSGNARVKSSSERKKPKYTHNLNADQPLNDLFAVDLGKSLPDFELDLPKVSVSGDSWLSRRAEISKAEEFSLSYNDESLFHSQDIDLDVMRSYAAGMMESVDKSSLYDFPLPKGLQISDESENAWVPPIEIDCCPSWRSTTTINNDLSRRSVKLNGIRQGDSTGEVINLEDSAAFGKDFFIATTSSFSPTLLDNENEYSARNSGMNKRSSSAINLPKFTNPTELQSGSGAWLSKNNKRHILSDEIRPNDIVNRNNTSMKQKELEKDMMKRNSQNPYKYFQEKGSFDSTPFSNALHSTQPQGSPWTIEFLNRVREKSRMHKQSVSYDLPSPYLRSSGNISKATKRRSPSILEFYKYEGGGTPQKIVQEKRLKRFSQAVNSLKTKKASASGPSSTPADKKARRTLSFSTYGSAGQSKLIWMDNDYQPTQKKPIASM